MLAASGAVPGATPSPAPVFAVLEANPPRLYQDQVFELVLKIGQSGVHLDRRFELIPQTPPDVLRYGPFHEYAPSDAWIEGQRYLVRCFRARARCLRAGMFDVRWTIRTRLIRSVPGWPEAARSTQEIELPVRPLSLRVLPLPEEDRPEGFTGAVGQFSMTAELHPPRAVVGDILRVTTAVHGTGNFDRVSAPRLEVSAGFTVYPPRLTSRADEVGTNTFEQMLVAREAGSLEIGSVSFPFFDPVEERYRTLRSGPFPVLVEPAADQNPAVSPAIAPPDTGARAAPSPRPWPWRRALPTALGVSPALIGTWAVLRLRRRARDRAPTCTVPGRSDPHAILAAAAAAAAAGDAPAVFAAIARALAAAFPRLPPHDRTGLPDSLEPSDDPREEIRRLVALCDRVRYGGLPAPPPPDLSAILERARLAIQRGRTPTEDRG